MRTMLAILVAAVGAWWVLIGAVLTVLFSSTDLWAVTVCGGLLATWAFIKLAD